MNDLLLLVARVVVETSNLWKFHVVGQLLVNSDCKTYNLLAQDYRVPPPDEINDFFRDSCCALRLFDQFLGSVGQPCL